MENMILSPTKEGAPHGSESVAFVGLPSDVGTHKGGFTLMELVTVIAMIAIIAMMLLPVLMRANATALTVRCLNNMKQLQTGYRMYVDDNNGYLPWNFIGGGVSNSWVVGNAQTDYNTSNIRHASLYPYNQNTKIYVCPANNYSIEAGFGARDDFNNIIKVGALIPETRTCSIESSMGGNSANSPNGPWTVTTSPGWNTYAKLSSIQPARLSAKIVFVDEASGSVDDGLFALWPMNSGEYYWWNIPASRHDRGGVFSFTDGHVEYRKWRGGYIPGNSMQASGPGNGGPGFPGAPFWGPVPNNPGDQGDLAWVQAGGPQYP